MLADELLKDLTITGGRVTVGAGGLYACLKAGAFIWSKLYEKHTEETRKRVSAESALQLQKDQSFQLQINDLKALSTASELLIRQMISRQESFERKADTLDQAMKHLEKITMDASVILGKLGQKLTEAVSRLEARDREDRKSFMTNIESGEAAAAKRTKG